MDQTLVSIHGREISVHGRLAGAHRSPAEPPDVVVSDALIGHRFQDVLQRVVRADGDRLTIAVFTCPGLRRVLAECKYPRLHSP
jgi:hypothetical protein